MEENRKAIQAVQDYIKGHLTNTITLFELSKVAGYSVFHLERIFKDLVGIRLFDYIRKLRLTEAAKSLRDSDNRVLDTALDYTFDSHEGFTRAFTKEFGISPNRYKRNPIPLPYFVAYKVLLKPLSEILKKEKNKMSAKVIFTQIIERPKRKAILKRGVKAEDYFAYCEEIGCDIWGVLTSVKEALFEPAGFWLSDNLIKKGTSMYVQGVEVPFDYSGEIPVGFELIDLDACTYLVFNGQPFNDEDFMEEIGIVMDAISEFKPEVYGYTWDDKAPTFQLEPWGYRGYIQAKPIKKI